MFPRTEDLHDHVLLTVADPMICPSGVITDSTHDHYFEHIDINKTLEEMQRVGDVAFFRYVSYDAIHVVLTLHGYNRYLKLRADGEIAKGQLQLAL